MKKFMRFTMVCYLIYLLSGAAVAQDVRKTLPDDLTLRQEQTVLAAALKKAEEMCRWLLGLRGRCWQQASER